jgi:hypothetical protein
MFKLGNKYISLRHVVSIEDWKRRAGRDEWLVVLVVGDVVVNNKREIDDLIEALKNV